MYKIIFKKGWDVTEYQTIYIQVVEQHFSQSISEVGRT